MKNKTTLLIRALAGSAVLLLSSAASAEMIKAYEGHKLFNSYCFLCHGTDGKGAGPLSARLKEKPKNLITAAKLRDMSDRDLIKAIKGEGDSHGAIDGMPQWGRVLADPQIEAIAVYVRFLQKSKAPLRGNPERGQQVYERYCVSCHGSGGSGNGVMTKVLPIKPADHSSSKVAEMSDKELINLILDGSREEKFMPGWKGHLSGGDVDDVVSYIRLLAVRK